MDCNHRFNRDEISTILKRAAELEHKNNIDDENEGLTIEELQQVSKEVGINPSYIMQAVEQLRNPNQSVASNLLGGPFTYQYTGSASGQLMADQWEEIVAEIRRIHGGIGKTGKLGNTLEWEQRKKEVGYVQIALAPKKEHTKLSINANYSYFAFITYLLIGVLGMAIFSTLFAQLNVTDTTRFIIGVLGMAGLLTGARFYLSHWMKQKRATYHALVSRFQELIGSEVEDDEQSIIFNETSGQTATEASSPKCIRE